MKLTRLAKRDDGLYIFGTDVRAEVAKEDLDPVPFVSEDGSIPTVSEMRRAVAAWDNTKIQGANAYRTPPCYFDTQTGRFTCAIPIYRITNQTRNRDSQLELGLPVPAKIVHLEEPIPANSYQARRVG
ncbi:MAG: hypothetical protein PHH00_02705 [Candidatus Nanoarchaeia archaeon]|nr:hypothetical protein [Candidatus Nanoarchaeia archaeon]